MKDPPETKDDQSKPGGHETSFNQFHHLPLRKSGACGQSTADRAARGNRAEIWQ
jgi:hypothetical protein